MNSLSVITWNLNCVGDDDAIESRAVDLAQELLACDADIVCLQKSTSALLLALSENALFWPLLQLKWPFTAVDPRRDQQWEIVHFSFLISKHPLASFPLLGKPPYPLGSPCPATCLHGNLTSNASSQYLHFTDSLHDGGLLVTIVKPTLPRKSNQTSSIVVGTTHLEPLQGNNQTAVVACLDQLRGCLAYLASVADAIGDCDAILLGYLNLPHNQEDEFCRISKALGFVDCWAALKQNGRNPAEDSGSGNGPFSLLRQYHLRPSEISLAGNSFTSVSSSSSSSSSLSTPTPHIRRGRLFLCFDFGGRPEEAPAPPLSAVKPAPCRSPAPTSLSEQSVDNAHAHMYRSPANPSLQRDNYPPRDEAYSLTTPTQGGAGASDRCTPALAQAARLVSSSSDPSQNVNRAGSCNHPPPLVRRNSKRKPGGPSIDPELAPSSPLLPSGSAYSPRRRVRPRRGESFLALEENKLKPSVNRLMQARTDTNPLPEYNDGGGGVSRTKRYAGGYRDVNDDDVAENDDDTDDGEEHWEIEEENEAASTEGDYTAPLAASLSPPPVPRAMDQRAVQLHTSLASVAAASAASAASFLTLASPTKYGRSSP